MKIFRGQIKLMKPERKQHECEIIMQISEEVGSGVEEKHAEYVKSMPASSNNSEAPKIATYQHV